MRKTSIAIAALLSMLGCDALKRSAQFGTVRGTIAWIPWTDLPISIDLAGRPAAFVAGEVIGWQKGDRYQVAVMPLASPLSRIHVLDGCVLAQTEDGAVMAVLRDGSRRRLGTVPDPLAFQPTGLERIDVRAGMGAYASANGSLWVASCQGMSERSGLFRAAHFDQRGNGIALVWGGGLAFSSDRGMTWRSVDVGTHVASLVTNSDALVVRAGGREFAIRNGVATALPTREPWTNREMHELYQAQLRLRANLDDITSDAVPILRAYRALLRGHEAETVAATFRIAGPELEIRDRASGRETRYPWPHAHCSLHPWGESAAAVCASEATKSQEVWRLSNASPTRVAEHKSERPIRRWSFSNDGEHYAFESACLPGPEEEQEEASNLCLRNAATSREVSIALPEARPAQLQLVGNRLLIEAGGAFYVADAGGRLRIADVSVLGQGSALRALALRGERDILGIVQLDDRRKLLVGGTLDDIRTFRELPGDVEQLASMHDGTVLMVGSHLHRLWTIASDAEKPTQVSAKLPRNVALRSRDRGELGRPPLLWCSGQACSLGEVLLVRGSPPFQWDGPSPAPTPESPESDWAGEQKEVRGTAFAAFRCRVSAPRGRQETPAAAAEVSHGRVSLDFGNGSYHYRGYAPDAREPRAGSGTLPAAVPSGKTAAEAAVFSTGCIARVGDQVLWLPPRGAGAVLPVSGVRPSLTGAFATGSGSIVVLVDLGLQNRAASLLRIGADSAIEELGEVRLEGDGTVLGEKDGQPVAAHLRVRDLVHFAPGKAPAVMPLPGSVGICASHESKGAVFELPVSVTVLPQGDQMMLRGRVHMHGDRACMTEAHTLNLRENEHPVVQLSVTKDGMMEGVLAGGDSLQVMSCVASEGATL